MIVVTRNSTAPVCALECRASFVPATGQGNGTASVCTLKTGRAKRKRV